MKKYLSLLLACLMLVTVLAGCGSENKQPEGSNTQSGPADTEPKATVPAETEEPEGDLYTWEITAEWRNVDLARQITLVNPGSSEWDKRRQNQEITLIPDGAKAYAQLSVPDPSADFVNNTLDDCKWVVNDDGLFDFILYEVISEPDPEDTDVPGELRIWFMKDYTWDITVVREEGCDGDVTITNPGLAGDWPERYLNVKYELTGDNTEFVFRMFGPASWVVDNSESWYKWGVDKHGNNYTVDFVCDKEAIPNDYETHGHVTVTISKAD